MSGRPPIATGRVFERRKVCPSCEQRMVLGVPKDSATWPARLSINAQQMDLLLIAAAEFDQLCEEAGEYSTAVAFVDWVRPEALSPSYASPVKVEPPRLPGTTYRARQRKSA